MFDLTWIGMIVILKANDSPAHTKRETKDFKGIPIRHKSQTDVQSILLR